MLGKGFFEDASRLGAGARGIFGSLAGEVERMVKTLLEARLRKLRLVSREEFEVVKMLAENARNEVHKLEERLRNLEKKQGAEPVRSARATKSKRTAKNEKSV